MSRTFLTVCVLAALCSVSLQSESPSLRGMLENLSWWGSPKPVSTAFVDFVKPLDYPVETHQVTTSDGYILTVFRIPGKKGETEADYKDAKRPPIFLQHGLLDSSDAWIVNVESRAMGFILANAGYDVWFGNMRGNKYSLYSKSSNYQSGDFWQFSWNEMARYDLPAMVEYVTKTTGYEQILYMGHSQGTVTMWAGLSDPATSEYLNQKIRLFVALGPAPYVAHSSASILKVAAYTKFASVLNFFGVHEFLLPTPWGFVPDGAVSELCKFIPFLCKAGTYLISDMDPNLLNSDVLSVYMDHFPSGTSIKNMQMWSQMVKDDLFQMYDYGTSGNKEHYGQDTPPSFSADFSNIKAPTAVFGGKDDKLADPTDVNHLVDLLDQAGSSVIYFGEYDNGHLGYFADNTIEFWTKAFALIQQYTDGMK